MSPLIQIFQSQVLGSEAVFAPYVATLRMLLTPVLLNSFRTVEGGNGDESTDGETNNGCRKRNDKFGDGVNTKT